MADRILTDPTRRHLLGGGLAIAAAGAAPSSATQKTPAGAPCMTGRSVRDFGAKGDGVTDDTDAFNRATQASAPWSPGLATLIYVPAGRYRIDGTVCVRKGQHLHGDGEPSVIDATRAQQHTFVLGSGLIAGRLREDPGGAPVQVSDLQTLGSAPTQALIFTEAQGFAMRRLFLSAVGTGIHVRGADGMIADIVVDQALNGIVFDQCQNINVSNVITYLANYAVTFKAGARDITISAAQFCYSRYAGLLLMDGATGIANVRVSACSFTMNQQFETFVGYVHCRASGAEMAFDNCSFRNWPGFAIDQAAGQGARLSFANCQFDGRPTNPLYNGADRSKGIATGVSGRFRLVECEFRHLHGEIINARRDLAALSFVGGAVEDCALPLVRSAPEGVFPISVRDVAGLATVSGATATLPSWPGVHWELALRLRGGNGERRWRGTVGGGDAVAGAFLPSPASTQGSGAVRLREAARDGATVIDAGANIVGIDLRTSI